MKKIINISGPFILGGIIISGAYTYYKYQETNYDFIMAIAENNQKDHSEFLDFYGETEPVFPDKKINAQTISGIDANNNGIRDDIDVWINRTAFDQNETKAMRQYAKVMQDLLKLCEKKDLNNVGSLSNKLNKAEICLEALSDHQRKVAGFAKERLSLLILNIEARKSCNDSYAQLTKDKIEASADGSHFYCDFEIQYFDSIIFGNAEWKKASTLK